MKALVMSGAANFGAMQAGALDPIFLSDFKPEMVVGTSAGALNAIYIAYDPSSSGVARLQDLWRAAGPKEVGNPTAIGVMRRLVRQQDSMVPSDALVSFLNRHLPQDVDTFGQLRDCVGVPAYVVAVNIETAELRVFGDDDEDRIIDGAVASSAVPPYFPPWSVDGERYLDGGIYSKLPIRVAIERGATKILALDVSHAMGSKETAKGILGMSSYAVSLMVEAQAAREIAWAKASGASLRVIHLPAPTDVAIWDYTQADRLIEMGRQYAARQLKAESLRFSKNPWIRLRSWFAGRIVKPDCVSPFTRSDLDS
jgi:NTE family protein